MPIRTPDGRYIVVGDRLWRASNPALTETERDRLTRELMAARRAVRVAKQAGDSDAESMARQGVQQAKVALGERGPVWWTDGAPELNRRMVENTPYREWWQGILTIRSTILNLLGERSPDGTICPSEVARAMSPEGWRALMPDVREVARELVREKRAVVTQKGKPLSADGEWRGPIRIGPPVQSVA